MAPYAEYRCPSRRRIPRLRSRRCAALRRRCAFSVALGLACMMSACATPPRPNVDANKVTLEFSDRYQAAAWPIQLWTKSWVTHVDFVLPDGRLLGATPLGVRVRRWTPPLHYERYTFRANPDVVLGFAKAQLGHPYDYRGDLAFVLKLRGLRDENAWFCSELVEAAALADGVDLSGRVPQRTSPRDLKTSLKLQALN